ncbi:MAG: hypothetical protein ICV84_02885 [Flavisolibacter sp.]|nr:hypothetical protein [Flavisolibacter sp.]
MDVMLSARNTFGGGEAWTDYFYDEFPLHRLKNFTLYILLWLLHNSSFYQYTII